MKRKRKIVMTVEKTGTGFSAYAENSPVFTTANSVPELINNAYEAIELFLQEEGMNLDDVNIKFEVDFQQFFKYYKVLNAKFLAKKIGMNPTLLSQYVQGKKKPSSKQTEKILQGIHQIGKELTDLNLFEKV